ncbi:MAG: tetratricopeptide repeat protein [Acidobacteriota bacterium]
MRWRCPAALLAATVLVGCASGGGGVSVDDQLDFGVSAGRRGYWQEALFRFERVLEASPDDPVAINNQAVALEALGRYEDALAAYKKALQKDPKNSSIKRNYARFAEFYTSYARGVLPKGVSDAKR